MREALVSIGDAEFEDLGIDDLVALYQAAGIRDFEELACHGDSSVIRVEVEQQIDEDRLQSLAYVEEWERIPTSDESYLYVIAFYAPELSDEIAEQAAELVVTCDPELSEDGATMSLVGPQAAIADTLDEYEHEGVSPNHRKTRRLRGAQTAAGRTD